VLQFFLFLSDFLISVFAASRFCPGNGCPCIDDGVGIGEHGAVFRIPYLAAGIAMHPDGRYAFVADYGNARVRSVDLQTGRVSTVSGKAAFDTPFPISVTPDGGVMVSDSSRR